MWNFLKNIFKFRRALFRYRSSDHCSSLEFLKTSLIDLCDAINKQDSESEDIKKKKLNKIKRAIFLLDSYINNNYLELADNLLGPVHKKRIPFNSFEESDLKEMEKTFLQEELEHRENVLKKSKEIETYHWDELFEILKGSSSPDSEDYDGSGIKTWGTRETSNDFEFFNQIILTNIINL